MFLRNELCKIVSTLLSAAVTCNLSVHRTAFDDDLLKLISVNVAIQSIVNNPVQYLVFMCEGKFLILLYAIFFCCFILPLLVPGLWFALQITHKLFYLLLRSAAACERNTPDVRVLCSHVACFSAMFHSVCSACQVHTIDFTQNCVRR